ncbi:MAG: TetR/AcrR family transcriptional regulator [Spongiibacteraceae bacterium]
MTGKRKYRSPRQVEREKKIVQVARKHLSEHGYQDVNMERLAREAGVTKMTLYNIFGSKDQLMAKIVSTSFLEITKNFVQSVRPGVPSIIARHDGIVAAVKSTPLYSDAIIQSMLNSDPDSKLVRVLLKDAYKFYYDQLTAAEQTGQLTSTVDKEAHSNQILGHEWGMLFLLFKQHFSIEAYEQQSRLALCTQLLAISTPETHEEIRNPNYQHQH